MSVFSLYPEEAQNILCAPMPPSTTQSIEAAIFADQFKVALEVGGFVLCLIIFAAILASRRGYRLWPLVGALLTATLVAIGFGFWTLTEKNRKAEASLLMAHVKVPDECLPNANTFNPVAPTMQLSVPPAPMPSIPPPPKEIYIEMNCYSLPGDIQTCSGRGTLP